MLTALVFFIILGVLVLVHEFGHFIAAKKNGIRVEEFGFGLPPRLFGVRKGETLYSINLLPFGGFVKLFGEEYQEIKKDSDPHLKKRSFVYKKPWQKASVIIAGVIGNLLLGWLIISYLFTQGVPVPTKHVIVEKVQKNSPAQSSRLQPKDIILKFIADKEYALDDTSNLLPLTKQFAGKEITLEIQRGEKILRVSIIPRKKYPADQGPLGIVITTFQEKKYSLIETPIYGLIESFNITRTITVELVRISVQIISLKAPAVDVTGPVGIARYTGEAVRIGKNAVLELVALLSLNLAIINILPFPALDGGRLAFVLYEWVRKKRVNERIERNLNVLGLAILLSIAILITIRDIIQIYR
ncbi:hypothetical protein COT62_02565 [Candidatus Roizmanbacteria bacterium CG09_land_8_20_14_0_10_41_9]|uniref:Peptidase M50 domain-containing protein n=1 Tax=Candidatus Roizmanbacteria bacterium CG09_land_8_20_14_0_10_41_9 TaxID=1974850 RepID=A0A2H0WUK7_9BACT|nr:MAG: hypothetical protein COT62_02565 [Candidatus Roizmanbacteria bacterium CG09_land_8_20_14_0_10_41_9]